MLRRASTVRHDLRPESFSEAMRDLFREKRAVSEDEKNPDRQRRTKRSTTCQVMLLFRTPPYSVSV